MDRSQEPGVVTVLDVQFLEYNFDEVHTPEFRGGKRGFDRGVMDASYNSPLVLSHVARCHIMEYSLSLKKITRTKFVVGTGQQAYGWELKVYSDDEVVSAFIHLLYTPSDSCPTVMFRFGIEGLNTTRLEPRMAFIRRIQQGSSWGLPKLLAKAEVEQYLVNERLSLFVEIKIVVGDNLYSGNVPGSYLTNTNTPNLGRALLESDDGDVVFRVQGKKIKAHKLVLAARSPVFRTQLEAPTAKIIPVDDIRPPVFKAMIEFLYTDRVPANIPLVQDLLNAAAKYELDELHKCCVEFLCLNITRDTVARSVALAEEHQISELKEACLTFVDRRALGTFFLSQEFTVYMAERHTKTAPTGNWWQRWLGFAYAEELEHHADD